MSKLRRILRERLSLLAENLDLHPRVVSAKRVGKSVKNSKRIILVNLVAA